MKKNLLTFTAFTLSLFMTGCNPTSNHSNDEYETLSFETMYDFSAISGINILNMNHTSTLRMKKSLTDSGKEIILENLQVVENMIAGDSLKSEEESSTKEGYEKMYTLTTSNFDGQHDIYTFYYNETRLEHDHDEEEIKIEGLVVMDDMEYQMYGKKEIEDNELEMKFKIMIDEDNYVMIEQEIENNEIEFEYTQYQNNKKVYETSLEYEKKRNENIEFEFTEKTGDLKRKYRYKFVNVDSKQYIEVKIDENNENTQAKIEVIVNEYNEIQYIFLDSKS